MTSNIFTLHEYELWAVPVEPLPTLRVTSNAQFPFASTASLLAHLDECDRIVFEDCTEGLRLILIEPLTSLLAERFRLLQSLRQGVYLNEMHRGANRSWLAVASR